MIKGILCSAIHDKKIIKEMGSVIHDKLMIKGDGFSYT
jgi:hypothetical protein